MADGDGEWGSRGGRKLYNTTTGEVPGPTGLFPRGKLNEDDAGELAAAVAADPKLGIVVVDFNTPVTWFALSPAEARGFAAILTQKADDCDRGAAARRAPE